MKPVTLKDVAKAAGVSVATASQVLRGSKKSWAGEATKMRVWEATRALGYRPNPAARLLASHQGHYFAIVTTRLSDLNLQEAAQRVMARVLAAGYIPFLVEVRNKSWWLYDNIESLADAVVFIGGSGKEFSKRVNQFASGVAAVVATGPQGSIFPEFVWDEEAGFDCILDHLKGLGHFRVALLGGGGERGSQSRRVALFRAAIERRGWDAPVVLVDDEEEEPVQSGRQMLVSLLKEHPEVTAAVGRNVEFTIGALAEAQQQGVRVPEDLSLVSFADSRLACGVWPRLTALRTPVLAAAEQAAEVTLAMLEGRPVKGGVTALDTELVLRESTAPPRKDLLLKRR